VKRALIIIPTYNEAENIANIIRELLAIVYPGVSIEVLVIDDNSTDGTSDLVKSLNDPRVEGIQICFRKQL
jgi:dolichol-phosphate mannosyltransferase